VSESQYANHAGTSWPKPAPVLAAAERAARRPPSTWGPAFEAEHAAVAAHFGTTPDRLLLTPGCTSALGVAVADAPWRPGDRAICSSMEHHALARPLAKLAGRGVEVVEVERGPHGPIDLGAVEEELRGGARLLAFCAASNLTGERLPVRSLIELGHRYGATVLVDAAQLVGWERLDLPALVAFGAHKAMHGVLGIGALYVAPTVVMDSPAAVCGLDGCTTGPDYCDVGSVDRSALAAWAAACAWNERQEGRLARGRAATERVAQAVEAGGARVLGCRPGEARLPTVAFAHRHPAAVQAGLAERGVVVAAGIMCAPKAANALNQPDGVVRVSFGGVDDDGEAVAGALGEVLASL
jgi:selenocysteine lyase/cysteine desulfurase